MTEMVWKERKHKVFVANFYKDAHLMAVIYDPDTAGKGGGGWGVIRAKHLIPIEYWSESTGFQSKSYRNKIKERLTIQSIELMCTDGEVFDNYNEAIDHEIKIFEAEKQAIEEMPDALRPDNMIGVDFND